MEVFEAGPLSPMQMTDASRCITDETGRGDAVLAGRLLAAFHAAPDTKVNAADRIVLRLTRRY